MRLRGLLLAVVSWSASASASGFYFSENGSKTLLQGGAFTAQADDLSALVHNPAGLALGLNAAHEPGFSFLLDGQLLFQTVTFNRQNNGFDPSAPDPKSQTVSASKAPYVLPFAAVGYSFKVAQRNLGLALGVYGPPAVGKVVFPTPDYTRDPADPTRYVNDPRRSAGHRYLLVSEDIFLAYPTLSAAFEIHPRFMVGLSAQLVVSQFNFSQALYSGLTTPKSVTQEDPSFDSIATINLPGNVGFTGIVGLLARPTDQLSFGASFRPPIPIKARGPLSIALGEKATQLGTKIEGDQAELTFTMPFELRVGGRFQPIERLGLNLDFVYQGWSSVDAQTLTPQGVTISILGQPPTPVPVVKNVKNWQNTWSVRLGGSFDVHKYVTVHAGAWYESQAAKDEYFNIDFAHAERLFVTAGATGHLGPIDVLLGGAITPIVTKTITNSALLQGTSDPTVMGGVVGAGIYTTGGFALTLGVRGHFEPAPKKAEPAPAVESK